MYINQLNEYAPAMSVEQVDQEVARIKEAAKKNCTTEVYKFCYSTIDLTTLSCNDSVASVTAFATKAAFPMEGQKMGMSRKLMWFATMTNPLPLGIFSAPSTLTLIPNSLKTTYLK